MRIKISLPFLSAVFFFLSFSETHSQENSSTNDITLPVHSLTESISLIDKSGHIHYIYKVYDHIRHLEFDTNLQLLNDSEYNERSISPKNIIGYQVTDMGEILIYFSIGNKRKFSVSTLFENKILNAEINLKLKGEKVIKAINYNNSFYLMSIDKGASTIHSYEFAGDQVTKKDYPFNTEVFYNWNNEVIPLANLFKKENVEFIESNIPSPIEQTSSPIKIYKNDFDLIFTLNYKRDETKVLTLNLSDTSTEVKTFATPNLPLKESTARSSNSFIYKDKLFQVSAAPKALAFHITDIRSSKIINEYSFKDDEPIPFKNSPIYQQNNLLSNRKGKEIEKTQKFLRKVSNSDLGLVVYDKDNVLRLSIGGVKKLDDNSADVAVAGILFGALGAAIYTSLSPTSRTYDLYANTKSVYIKSLFSADTFTNIEGKATKNAFDKIRDYTENNDLKRISLGNIIKYNNSYIFSYYNEKNNQFTLVQFEI